MESGFTVEHDLMSDNTSKTTTPADSEFTAKVVEVLELIRPGIQQDGGDIELVQVTSEGEVHIRFLGACIGCPSSQITLRDGIARNLRERVPGVREVLAID